MEEWFPDAVLVDDAVLDLDEVEPTSAPRVDDPAVLEVVARLIADHEQRWLDEHDPALGGRTPREAVQDPIGREEVLQLLAGFPEPEPGAPGMSPARLRTALGL